MMLLVHGSLDKVFLKNKYLPGLQEAHKADKEFGLHNIRYGCGFVSSAGLLFSAITPSDKLLTSSDAKNVFL